MFRSFSFDHPQGAICRTLCRYYTVFRWFAFVEYWLGMWLYVYIICLCVCLVLLSVGDLFVNCLTIMSSADLRSLSIYLVRGCMCISSVCVCAWCCCQWEICLSQTALPLTRAPSTHTNRWYTHTATYQVNTQRTQISRRHYSNGTKHGIWPPEDGRIKSTEKCRGLFVFTNMFLTF
jgi:hypothetical protein